MIIEKIQKLYSNKTLFNGALFSMFSFINRGISFLLLLILANYITPHEYGYLSLYSTVGMVLSFFIAMSTTGYAGVVFFKEGKEGISKKTAADAAAFFIEAFYFVPKIRSPASPRPGTM